ncbi:MAG: PAS domain-containing protein [Myxococcales bacterium]|nr:MAG: PAS domain-containing protein [Myxococcales bacterium]
MKRWNKFGLFNDSHRETDGEKQYGDPMSQDVHYLKKELYEQLERSPELFDFIQAGSLDGIWYSNVEDPNEEWMSDEFKALLGYEEDEIPNATSWRTQNIHPEDFNAELKAYRLHCANSSFPYDLVLRYRHKTGSTVWVRSRGMAIRDEAGKAIRFLGVHTNLTALKNAEEHVVSVLEDLTLARDGAKERYAKLITVIDKAPVGVLLTTEDLRIELMSARAAQIYQIEDAPSAAGQSVFEVSPFIKAQRSFYEKALEGEDVQLLNVKQQINFEDNYVNFHFSPVRSQDKTVGVLVVMENVTEGKRHQSLLARSERMVSVGTMAAGVCHEINNSLAVVVANLDYLAKEVRDLSGKISVARSQELNEALVEAQDSSERIQCIVRDLRTFSKADGSKPVVVDVHHSIETAINMSLGEIRRTAKLVKDFGTPPEVMADETHLVQILVNLLVNAAQSIKSGADNAIRIVTKKSSSGSAIIEIHDTGVGISNDVRKRIFDPFFTTKSDTQGTGLGLSVSRGLVENMGGTLHCKSQPGKGSTFFVELPAANKKLVSAQPTQRPAPQQQADRGRVLVIDDDKTVASAMSRVLRAEHDVDVVNAANDALMKIRSGEQYDVVLCDLVMPKMTGMEFFDILTHESEECAKKVVFITGGASSREAHAFLDRVSNQRFYKPFNPRQLRDSVRAMVPHT